MQSTYQKKVDETAGAVRRRTPRCRRSTTRLKAELAETTRQRDKLAADFAYVTGSGTRPRWTGTRRGSG